MNLELPSADTKRWSSRRKAAVVVAVRSGGLTRKQAYERYNLSEEELAAWEAAFARRGIPGSIGNPVRRRAGRKMNLALPSADTKRWSSRRKAAVVVAVRSGGLTREQAYERYQLSEEELAAWEAAFAKGGPIVLANVEDKVAAPPPHEPA